MRKFKRLLSMFLCSILCVAININPIGVVVTALANSEFVEDLGVLGQNIIYLASNSVDNVFAATESSSTITEDPDTGVTVVVNVDTEVNIEDAINDIMGDDGATLTDIQNAIGEETTVITGVLGYTEDGTLSDDMNALIASLGYNPTISSSAGSVAKDMANISEQLAGIQGSIEDISHTYRVAHLYSLNNTLSTLWKPYTSEVPYVEDWAIVTGRFANVYTGYWDTGVTTIQNPGGYETERALEVLGYDSILRYEGVIVRNPVAIRNSVKNPNGMSGQSTTCELSGRPTSSIVTYTKELIPEENITWLDAVTVLYKALGQNEYTYQSFMSENPSITPETSPLSQNLSNIVEFDGYDFYMFLSRSNLVTGDNKKTIYHNTYWTKAVNDGFVLDSQDMNSPISESDFYLLASDMMQAFGEPVINRDEIKALLQVYGSKYPIQLGQTVADAWAYLKARGCLSENINWSYSGNMSRNKLLDVCMRIADPDSREDYKVINVVLDLADLYVDDGYFPVYDLEYSNGAFKTSISINYDEATYYNYLIPYTENTDLGNYGTMRIYSTPDSTESQYMIEGSEYQGIVDIAGTSYYNVAIPKSYTGNAYIRRYEISEESKKQNGALDYICIPTDCLGGGFFTSVNISDKVGVLNSSSFKEFDVRAGDEMCARYIDYKRAGEEKPVPTQVSYNANILETVAFYWDYMTTPMAVNAAPSEGTSSGESVNVTYTDDYVRVSPEFESGEYSYINAPTVFFRDSRKTVQFGYAQTNNDILVSVTDNATKYDCSVEWSSPNTPNSLRALNIASALSINENLNEYVKKTMVNRGWTVTEVMKDILGMDRSYFRFNSESLYDGIVNSRKLTTDRGSGSINYYYSTLVYMALAGIPSTVNSVKHNAGDSNTNLVYNWANIDLNRCILGGSVVEPPIDEWLCVEEESLLDKLLRSSDRVGFNGSTYTIGTKDSNRVLSELGYADIAQRLGSNSTSSGSGESLTESVDLNTNVATSTIMNVDEQILISWSDLKDSGFVIVSGSVDKPTMSDDGTYHFYTKYGQVKVNDYMSTIQIGTTLYDLHQEGKSPRLVYIDDSTGEYYFDYRCVMGVINNDITRNEESTEIVKQTLGSGDFAIYDLGSSGSASSLFSLKDVNCYNYPEVINGNYNDNINPYTIPIVTSTNWDDEAIDYDDGTRVYWPDAGNINGSYHYRMQLQAFVPTANWVYVIDDSGSEISGKLFVYYLRTAFEDGYVDTGTEVLSIADGGENTDASKWIAMIDGLPDRIANISTETSDGNTIKKVITTYYPSLASWTVEAFNALPWYDLMTIIAIVDLYELTGSYYISSDFVMREFDLTNMSAMRSYDWRTGEYGVSNNPGMVYWIDTVGALYNIPKLSEWNLTDYLCGKIPLPIVQYDDSYELLNLTNNYYGYTVPVPSEDMTLDWSKSVNIPYGYYLTNTGFKTRTGSGLSGGSISDLVTSSNSIAIDGVKPLPFTTDDFTDTNRGQSASDPPPNFIAAPIAVYYYFGGNYRETLDVGNMTQYLIDANRLYWGTHQLQMKSSSINGYQTFSLGCSIWNDFQLSSNSTAYRVHRSQFGDTYVMPNANAKAMSVREIADVEVKDYQTSGLNNLLDDIGANDLIQAIDEGASIAILIAFTILPMIGVILMIILVGLSFMSESRIVQAIADKFIDPVRILTFGHKSIHEWSWRKVLLPCMVLFISFSLFLNANLIRLIKWFAEWYSILSTWLKSL